MSDVTCTPKLDQCEDKTTTSAPLTTKKPTPEPVFEECLTLKNRTDCCGNLLYRCIFVNCNGTTTKQTYKGCYSASNQTTIQTDCGTTSYVDSCAATTPSAITTASPSTDKRHFDGASFIGGIVLCAGIILIIFFVMKWYRSRQASSNYHQM
ncbi:CD164 [Mytilus coruscus]|uniref:CD164 n=1 Tax=Mytilus coruscus TaxID=42192 RepID=A0A6J8CG20_MYTCO|nr:CD164 [Mytilus coruscus]